MPDPNNVILGEHGLAWIGICKNANSAIKHALLESLGRPVERGREHDPSLLRYAGVGEIVASGLPCFAVVRDPYDRLASCWRNKCFASWRPGFAGWGLAERMDFADFVRVVADTPDRACHGFGQHWRSQVWELTGGSMAMPGAATILIRFEALDAGWEKIRRISRLPLPALRHCNASEGPAAVWTRKLRDTVYDRYCADFDELGYPS